MRRRGFNQSSRDLCLRASARVFATHVRELQAKNAEQFECDFSRFEWTLNEVNEEPAHWQDILSFLERTVDCFY